MSSTATFYGGCGVEGCLDCRPLFDADNQEIPGTDTDRLSGEELLTIIDTYSHGKREGA